MVQLRLVAQDVGATRALGVSMGAGTIVRALDAFERVVLVLPSGADRDLTPFHVLADAIDSGDLNAIEVALRGTQPEDVRDRADVVAWSRGRARELRGTHVAAMLRSLPSEPPPPLDGLASYPGEVLVIGQEGDPLHPVRAAVELADAFENARLELFPSGGLLWAHRRRVREVIGGFLNAS